MDKRETKRINERLIESKDLISQIKDLADKRKSLGILKKKAKLELTKEIRELKLELQKQLNRR